MYRTYIDGQPALIWAGLEPITVDGDAIVRKTLLIASLAVLVVTAIGWVW